jgi:hypothetical protein
MEVQIDTMQGGGCEKVFAEQVSAMTDSRGQLALADEGASTVEYGKAGELDNK